MTERKPRARYGPHLIVMSTFVVVGLAAGWLLLPGDDERIAALDRDGDHKRALQLLEARFEQGDRRQRTLFLMHKIYEIYGDTHRARGVLEMLAEQRPRDAHVQRQLARLYKQTQDEASYMRALRRQLALRYAEPVCRELIGLLRRNGEYEEEQGMIADCRSRGYRRADDLVRLAFLEAASGRPAETASILRAVDDRRWLRSGSERLLLFSTLLETGQAPQALRRSVRWLKGQPDEELAIELVSQLGDAKRNDLAMQLAREVGRPGDAVSLSVAELMLEQQQQVAARAFLAGWLEHAGSMTSETTSRFVAAALDADDPALAFRGAEQHGLALLGQSELAALAQVLSQVDRAAEFDKVAQAIRPESLSGNPLLHAAIEVHHGRIAVARLHLDRVRAEELDEDQLNLLGRLAERTGRPPAVTAVLRELGVEAPPSVGPAQRAANRVIRRANVTRLKQRRRVGRVPATAIGRPPAAAQGLPTPLTIGPVPPAGSGPGG